MYEMDQYTVSLLHFEDGLKDESGKVWTPYSGATTSNVQSKFGGSSLYLNGQSQYLTTLNSTDFDFGSGYFTIDWWEYRTVNNNLASVLARDLNVNSHFIVGDNISGSINCYLSSSEASWDIASAKSMGVVNLNIWTHYAVVRKDDTFYTFQNGVQISTWTSNVAFLNGNGTPAIANNNGGYHFTGYIDELRVSKGIARWTTNFTPGSSIDVPTPTGNELLRVTMNDSSEREYRLSSAEVDDFVKWFSRTIGTGTTEYMFNDPIDNSKEYLSFEKIISFKVIPLTK